MLDTLLITYKHGRTVKTYGVNWLEVDNMKFTFLCIVIAISCSVRASADLEMYPDLKFELSSEQRARLENSDVGPSYPFQRWPWQRVAPIEEFDDDNRKQEQDVDFGLPDRLLDFEEFLDRNRNNKVRNKQEDAPPIYYNPSFEEAYEEFRNLEAIKDRFRYPNTQILDDVRPYPHEDDFTFGDDGGGGGGDYEEESDTHAARPQEQQEEEEEEDDDDDKPDGMANLNSHHAAALGPKIDVKNNDQTAAKGRFDDVKFVDDPTQFAFSPSDARFFRDSDKSDVPEVHRKVKDNNILLTSRSDGKFSDLDNLGERDHTTDNHVEVVAVKPHIQDPESAGVYIIAVVAGISAAATVGLIAVGIGWYNLQKHVKSTSDVEYPAYGVTGPNKDISPSGDRRLAQSAQMYHYQHQKQQIIAMESRAAAGDRHGSVSEADSDEENEEGDYTVYECPGLAPTGEMEVKNPLFQDDPTPAQASPAAKPNEEQK